MFYGPNTRMTTDLIPTLESQPDAVEKAKELGIRLKNKMQNRKGLKLIPFEVKCQGGGVTLTKSHNQNKGVKL